MVFGFAASLSKFVCFSFERGGLDRDMLATLDEPSTSKRTVDSVHGVWRTDTPGMGRRHHNVDELNALEQRAELFRRQPRPPDDLEPGRIGQGHKIFTIAVRHRQSGIGLMKRAGSALASSSCMLVALEDRASKGVPAFDSQSNKHRGRHT